MVLDSVSEKNGIEKSIGFGIGKNLVSEKVSDSVLFRFWVSSHTVFELCNVCVTVNVNYKLADD